MNKTRAILSLRILLLVAAVIGATAWNGDVYAQRSAAQIRSILSNFKSWRYSNISCWQINGEELAAVTEVLVVPPVKPAGLADFEKNNRSLISTIQESVDEQGCDPDPKEVENALKGKGRITAEVTAAINYYIKLAKSNCLTFKSAYLVTSRYIQGDTSLKVIGLVTSQSNQARASANLGKSVEVRLASELERIGAPKSSPSANLADYLKTLVIQQSCADVTAPVQGIGEDDWMPKKIGVTKLISDDDVQQYIRISEGQPQQDYYENELTLGFLDLLRFRHYEAKLDENGAPINSGNDSTIIYNRFLPKYGVELKYGLDEINYPSLWSERMSANVLWESYKLGVILPTAGWSNLAKDVFNADRRLTNAGFGVNGAFDFPMKIINQSGVFNFSASYVFGDPKSNPTPGRDANKTGQSYLPRIHMQGHYSFAVNIDETHFFRFKFGGTYYSMERWKDSTLKDVRGKDSAKVLRPYFDLANGHSVENIGGVSGKIEYMTLSRTVPWGASAQFFDGSILGEVWLQVPISKEFAVRGDARLFRTLTRDPKDWERETLFIPSLQFVVNF